MKNYRAELTGVFGDPVDDNHKINAELHAYNAEIANRPQVIAANKIDLITMMVSQKIR